MPTIDDIVEEEYSKPSPTIQQARRSVKPPAPPDEEQPDPTIAPPSRGQTIDDIVDEVYGKSDPIEQHLQFSAQQDAIHRPPIRVEEDDGTKINGIPSNEFNAHSQKYERYSMAVSQLQQQYPNYQPSDDHYQIYSDAYDQAQKERDNSDELHDAMIKKRLDPESRRILQGDLAVQNLRMQAQGVPDDVRHAENLRTIGVMTNEDVNGIKGRVAQQKLEDIANQSFSPTATRFVSSVGSKVASSVISPIARGAGMLGVDGAGQFADELNRRSGMVSAAAQEGYKKADVPAWMLSSLDGAVTAVYQSAIGGNAIFGADMANKGWTEAKDRGLSTGDALVYSGVQGAIGALMPKVLGGFSKGAETVTGSFLKQAASGLLETGKNVAAFEIANKLASIDPDSRWDREGVKDLIKNIASGTLAFGLVGAAEHGLSKLGVTAPEGGPPQENVQRAIEWSRGNPDAVAKLADIENPSRSQIENAGYSGRMNASDRAKFTQFLRDQRQVVPEEQGPQGQQGQQGQQEETAKPFDVKGAVAEKLGHTPAASKIHPDFINGAMPAQIAVEETAKHIAQDPETSAVFVGLDVKNQKGLNEFFGKDNARADREALGPFAEILKQELSKVPGAEPTFFKQGGDELGALLTARGSIDPEEVRAAAERANERVQAHMESKGIPLDLENPRAKKPLYQRSMMSDANKEIYDKQMEEYLQARGSGFKIGVAKVGKNDTFDTISVRIAKQHDEAGKSNEPGNLKSQVNQSGTGAPDWQPGSAAEINRGRSGYGRRLGDRAPGEGAGVAPAESNQPAFAGEARGAAESRAIEQSSNHPADAVHAVDPEVAVVPTKDIVPDPERLQWKRRGRQGESGSTGSIKGNYNDKLSGVIHVWRDPETGVIHPVDGHNRQAKAIESGQKTMRVQFIRANTAEEAKSSGAMLNIAQGHGDPIDAANFFREHGLDKAALEKQNLNLSDGVARKGLGLANLAPDIFRRVEGGQYPMERYAIIGERVPDHEDQRTLMKIMEKKPGLSDAAVRELADQVREAPKEKVTEQTLFGSDEKDLNLFVNKAKLMAKVVSKLQSEKRLFGTVGDQKAADTLSGAWNKLNVEQNKQISQKAEEALYLWDKFKNNHLAGILDDATRQVGKGKSLEQITDGVYPEIRRRMEQLAGGSKASEIAGASAAGATDGNPTEFNADAAAERGGQGAGSDRTGEQPTQRGHADAASLEDKLRAVRDKLDEVDQRSKKYLDEFRKGIFSNPIDPFAYAHLVLRGAAKLGKGLIDFALWSKEMVSEYGPRIQPHLQDIFDAVHDYAGRLSKDPQKYQTFEQKRDLARNVVTDRALAKNGDEALPPTPAAIRNALGDEGKKQASQTEGIIREHNAQRARNDEQDREALKQFSKSFRSKPFDENMKFIDAMETGKWLQDPKLRPVAQTLRTMLDGKRDEVQALGTGKLDNWIEGYFPHIWQDPKRAQGVIQKMLSKRPMQGSSSFLKQRSIPTTREGLQAGLVPVSENPIDLALLKMREMNRYIMAQRILGEMKSKQLAKFVKATQKAPDGYKAIDDKIATVYGGIDPTGALKVRGHYYAPAAAADTLNTFLSPGLRGNAAYDAYMGVGNVMNQANLGLSGFHLDTTGLVSVVSKVSLGIREIASGKITSGLKTITVAPMSPFINLMKGSKVLQEYLRPGTSGGDMAQIVDTLVAGGGRARMDDFYKTGAWNKFRDAIAQGKAGTAALYSLPGVMEASAKPIMEWWVPRMKLGSFLDESKHEMAQLPPTASRDEVRSVMGKAWDSTDDRFGQMVYDNVFVNKMLKDVSFGMVRAVGWNLGTIRGFVAGPIKDALQAPQRAKSGEPVITRRMADMMALTGVAMLAGATYQYMRTGRKPDELKDYFYPKDGSLDDKGNPNRVALPTYMKDLSSYSQHPVDTLVHKSHPLLNTLLETIQNKDFFGNEIRNPDDPAVKQLSQQAQFLAKQFIPFSVSNLMEQRRRGEPLGNQIQSLIGIVPAPKEMVRSPAQNKMNEYLAKTMPSNLTPEEVEQQQARKAVRLQAGTEGKSKAFESGVKSGLSAKQTAATLKAMRGDHPFVASFKHLNLEQARNVYALADEREKALWDVPMKLKEMHEEMGNLKAKEDNGKLESGEGQRLGTLKNYDKSIRQWEKNIKTGLSQSEQAQARMKEILAKALAGK